jgi:predicted O-methyltransferase YrrM
MAGRAPFLPEKVARYIHEHSVREPLVLRELREATKAVPMSGMQIGADQGQFLQLLVQAIGARRCLEIGTYTGYSALAVALALPEDGRLICCDISEEWTAVGKPFWKKAGVEQRIDLRIGPALETLKGLKGPFDFVFIDADKPNYLKYYEGCLPLVRKNGIIAIDNTLWSGAVADPTQKDADTVALPIQRRPASRPARRALDAAARRRRDAGAQGLK